MLTNLNLNLFFQDSIVLQSVFTNAREKLSKEWEDDNELDDGQDDMEEDEPIATSSGYVFRLCQAVNLLCLFCYSLCLVKFISIFK